MDGPLAGPSTLSDAGSCTQDTHRAQVEQRSQPTLDEPEVSGPRPSAVQRGKRKANDHTQDSHRNTNTTSHRSSRSDSLSAWLPKHDARLRRLSAAAAAGPGPGPGPDWKDIARQMQHWSARQCEARLAKLEAEPNEGGEKQGEAEDELDQSEAEEADSEIPARPARRAAWSEAEDKVLRDTVLARRAAGEPVDWASFPKILPGRTESACTKRWHHAFSRTVEGGSGLWTAEEDEILLSNVMERRARGVRVDWASFPALLPGRSRIAVTQRWHNCLSKQAGINEAASGAGHWSAENDALLAAVVRRRRSGGLSNDWSAVASHFPGRTALGCQKRWYQHVRAPDERRASGDAGEGDDGVDREPELQAATALEAEAKRPSLLTRQSSVSGGASHSSSRTTSSGLSSATSAMPDTPPSTFTPATTLDPPTLKSTTSSSSLHQLLHHTSADAGVAEILSSFSAASFAHARPPPAHAALLDPPPSPRQVGDRKASVSRLSLAHLAPGSGLSSGEAVDEGFRFWDEMEEEEGGCGEAVGTEGRNERAGAASYVGGGIKAEEEERGLPDHLSPFTFNLAGLRR